MTAAAATGSGLGFVSFLPEMTGSVLPPPTPQYGLSDDERRLISGLSQKLTLQALHAVERWLYYDGLQRLNNYGISIPPALSGVRTVVDWPRICVDPIVQRCRIDGFRFPNATDVDSELADLLADNDFGSELPLGLLDALVVRCGYGWVGSPDVPGESPLLTFESPQNMAVTWDPRRRRVTNAYTAYEADGVFRAVLLTDGVTVSMSREDGNTAWTVDDRDEHGFPVPVVRLVNRARTSNREGRSEITPAIMSVTDMACRTLLGMDIAREFYSIPHKYILGASEDDFIGPDGAQKSGMDMAMSKFLAFERDEAGQLPTVGQFTAMDPSVFTKIIDEGAKLMSAFTGFPAQYFGQTTTANPASADAIRVAENGIDRRAESAQLEFTSPVRQLAQLVWRFAHLGEALPVEMKRLQVDWVDAATPTPAATTDAVVKQVQAGILPPQSDVTLKKLEYSAVDRARIAQDWLSDENAAFLARLGSSIAAKEARAANAAINIVDQASAPQTPPAPDVQSGR